MKNSRFQSLVLLFITGFLVVTYQNCSVYRSAGIDEFAKELLKLNTGNACLPYIDVNEAAQYMGLSGIELFTNQTGANPPDPLRCLFTSKVETTSPEAEVSCLVTSRSETEPEIMAQLSEELYLNADHPETAEQILSDYLGGGSYSDFVPYLNDTSEKDYYGYSYTVIEPGENPKRIFKFVGGRSVDGVLDNACAGAACGICSLIVKNSDSVTIDETKLTGILENFILKITQRQ